MKYITAKYKAISVAVATMSCALAGLAAYVVFFDATANRYLIGIGLAAAASTLILQRNLMNHIKIRGERYRKSLVRREAILE